MLQFLCLQMCVYGGSAVPQGGVGDRHLVTVPQGVVGTVFLKPLDAPIPKIPFSFFALSWFWVTSEARGSVSAGFWGPVN